MKRVREALVDLPVADGTARALLTERAANILRPAGAFARLDDVAVWMGGWQRTAAPCVQQPAALVFAADHGVTVEGVSAYPAEVTTSMLAAFRSQRSTLHALTREVGASVHVYDVGVGNPTANLRYEPAMTVDEFVAAFEAGRAATRAVEADLLVVGEMGIGNTTAAAAICACLLGGSAATWVGRGTGIDDVHYSRKCAVVADACARTATIDDPLEVFRHLGGRELAAMAGAYVQARHRGLPVLLDGFLAAAALLPLWSVEPRIIEHCWAGHCSAEGAHRAVLAQLGLAPLIDLGLRLGEGSGALLAVPMVAMACRALVEVPTFGEWFGEASS